MTALVLDATSRRPLAMVPELDATGYGRLREAWLAGRNENTQRAYAHTVRDLAGFLGRRSGSEVGDEEAFAALLGHGGGAANLMALEYRADMGSRGLSSSTIAARLSRLRALVKLARTLGMVGWVLEVESPRVQVYRDTSGPSLEAVRVIAAHVRGAVDQVRAARDRALLALMYGRGLRRGEALSLDVEHVDVAGRRLFVLAKGHREREWVPVSPDVAAAVDAWLKAHPFPEAGPLFVGWTGRGGPSPKRLTGTGLEGAVARWGKDAMGLKVRPHGLRHACATHALNAGLEWAEVAGLTRHADPSTLRHYDDARKQRGARAADVLAGLVAL